MGKDIEIYREDGEGSDKVVAYGNVRDMLVDTVAAIDLDRIQASEAILVIKNGDHVEVVTAVGGTLIEVIGALDLAKDQVKEALGY